MTPELLKLTEDRVKAIMLEPSFVVEGEAYINLLKNNLLNSKQKAVYNQLVQEDADSRWEYVGSDTLDSFTEVLKIFGVSNCRFFYSGFSSQGDGACFTGRYTYTPKWRELLAMSDYSYYADVIMADLKIAAKCQRDNVFDLGVDIKHRGRYHHSGSMMFDTESHYGRTDYQHERHNKANGTFIEAFTSIADTVYRYLEEEYKWCFNHENWVEIRESNDTLSIWVDERGNITSHEDMVDMLRLAVISGWEN